jgi:hypothetical protein
VQGNFGSGEKFQCKADSCILFTLEPASLDTIDNVRSGEFGHIHLFASTFAQPIDQKNHCAPSGKLAG